MRQSIGKLLGGGILVVFLISYLWLSFPSSSSQEGEMVPAYLVSEELEDEFSEKVLSDAELNLGVTIYLISLKNSADDTQVGEFVDFAVLNHTNEYIVFPNGAYGLRIFSPAGSPSTWKEINPSINFGDVEIALAPHTEAKGTHPGNTVSLLYSDYAEGIPNKLRFCVFGIGQTTQKPYVGCADAIR